MPAARPGGRRGWSEGRTRALRHRFRPLSGIQGAGFRFLSLWYTARNRPQTACFEPFPGLLRLESVAKLAESGLEGHFLGDNPREP